MRKLQLVVFILVALVNFGVQAFTDSPFDDDPEVLIQPAGYAFSIWGVIFLGMLIYSVFQLKMERVESPHLDLATKAGISAGLASIAFVPIFYTGWQWLGWLNIIWHLISLIVLYRALYKQVQLEPDPHTHWYYLPTQLYLGWISAATAVSTGLMLRETFGLSFDEMTEVYLTVAVIAALILVALWINTKGGQAVSLTIVWALGGLIVEQQAYLPITYACVGGIVLIAVAVANSWRKGEQLYEQEIHKITPETV